MNEALFAVVSQLEQAYCCSVVIHSSLDSSSGPPAG